jgi:cytochrome c-type biogenesis protein CcmE
MLMKPVHKKLCIAGTVLTVALAYLVYAGIKLGSSYYLPVDVFMAGSQYHSQQVRLHGKVGQDDLVLDKTGLSARFQLLGERHTLPVSYGGVIPDLFKPGGEVVVQGRLGPDGVFHADQILTKCASKYEEDPEAHTREPT